MEECADSGHTLYPAYHLIEKINNLPIDPPFEITTDTLFDTVTYANVVENDADAQTLVSAQIGIEAYAIQSDRLPENTTIEGAYAIYLNQNS